MGDFVEAKESKSKLYSVTNCDRTLFAAWTERILAHPALVKTTAYVQLSEYVLRVRVYC